MSAIAFVGPVKDVDGFRSLAKEISGAKKGEHAESRRRLGTTKERVFLAQTPMGAMVCAYAEGQNAGFSMARMRASSNPFDKYYLDALAQISGRNLAEMPAGPPPHLAFEWANGKPGKASTMIAAPVAEPAKFWQFCREMTTRYPEHGESRERQGITFERAFFLHDAKMVAVYIEGDDPAQAVEKSLSSTAAYDQWFADRASDVHGIDFRANKPPTPELLVSYGD